MAVYKTSYVKITWTLETCHVAPGRDTSGGASSGIVGNQCDGFGSVMSHTVRLAVF